jgi:short-subunit dehydrogenase
MPFLDLPADKAEELVNLNVLAPVRMIHSALPGMVERGKGTVVSFSSLLAYSAASENPQLPKRAVYAASKAFLLTFFQILALELRDTGVKVQIVCPGIVKTEFHTRQNMDLSGRPRLEPEEIVKASMICPDLAHQPLGGPRGDLSGAGNLVAQAGRYSNCLDKLEKPFGTALHGP